MWRGLDLTRGYLEGLLQHRIGRVGVRVFCYHGIVEQKRDERLERNLHTLSAFKEHLAFLRRLRVMSLSELVETLRAASVPRHPAALITFDDGYANNLLAAEMLAAARLPWSIFVSTGAVGRGRAIWTVELSLLILHGEVDRITAFEHTWDLRGRENRLGGFQDLRMKVKRLSAGEREAVMHGIRQQFPVGERERLLERFPSLQMLEWPEIESLASAGVEIGSHGVKHEIHHGRQPADVRRSELVESKQRLEQEVGRPCRAFAFPNGDWHEASCYELREAGYEVAFTTAPGTATPDENRFLIPRLDPGSDLCRFVNEFYWEPPSTLSDLSVR